MKQMYPSLQNIFTALILLALSSPVVAQHTSTDNMPQSISSVQLVSFAAKPANGKVLLSWSVTNEKNVDHFIVEKSCNNKDFEQAGIVFTPEAPAGISSYQFPDALRNENTPFVYYRLIMADKNGLARISEVKTVALSAYAIPHVIMK